MVEGLVDRHPKNPLLVPRLEHDEKNVYNPAVLSFDGITFLLPRVLRSSSQQSDLTLAWSTNNTNFERLNYPIMFATESYEMPHAKTLKRSRERGGVEDARATIIDDTIYLAYTAFSDECRIAIASMNVDKFLELFKKSIGGEDLSSEWNDSWQRHGLMFANDRMSRNASLGQVGSLYSLVYRKGYEDTKIGFSDSPIGPFNGDNVFISKTLGWESERLGISSQPIVLNDGLTMYLYHGVEEKSDFQGYNKTYHIGLIFSKFKKINDTVIITNYKLKKPLISPTKDELSITGEWLKSVNVAAVFSCGANLEEEDKLRVYYGVGDEHICSAVIKPLTIFDSEEFEVEEKTIKF
ncbi:hypothetical protein GOV04_05190 [Candidatus Woesearchaeota archaeon]|nr:hypothetical protein [Candidatus Woesearchaeota archaeon]